ADLELVDVVVVDLVLELIAVRLGGRPVLLRRGALLRPALALAAAAAASGLREVAEQLAGDGPGLSGGPHRGAPQHPLALRRVGHARGQQGRGETAVLVSGGMDDPPGV